MARKVRNATIDSRNARLKLAISGKPHFIALEEGLHLGYRKGKHSRKWVARIYVGGHDYRVETLDGIADDHDDADGHAVLSFSQAQEKARKLYRAAKGDNARVIPLTVSMALDEYRADLATRGGDVQNANRLRGHLSAEWLDRPVASLEVKELRRWRDSLRKTPTAATGKPLSAASTNRVGNDLRAMLNLAADNHGLIQRPWKTGLKALTGAKRSNNVILPEPMVRAIVAAAYVPTYGATVLIKDDAERHEAEDEARRFAASFGLFVEVVAMTGARPVQVARLTVGDLPEDGAPRVMMPSSLKGKGEKKITRRPVPISADLMVRLREVAAGRPKRAPLLVKPSGKVWSKSDHTRPFARAVIAAGADPEEVTTYALRHSSIVRQIKAGVPLRIIAVTHDTSTQMIEAHYSNQIADHSDELTRAALLDFSTPAKGNVVGMPGR